MNRLALIVAGGSGQRMMTEIPKQFLLLRELPVLMHTLNVFHSFDPKMKLRLVLPEAQIANWESLCERYNFRLRPEIIPGGETRFHSVLNGLEGIPDGIVVAIHDGVRPLVSHQTLARCFEEAERSGAVVPVSEIRESVRKLEGEVTLAVNRSEYLLVQTPAAFHSEIIRKAYRLEYRESFTDDASVVEAAGYKITITRGNPENIKITSPMDLKIAEALMR
ncbi:MAG: 2-C-methyl-D-erythritol 4-phosphate cytidylyltransferase [Bacteroidales bacterium]|nr:2-C-methyl-D-erythritol 4-phosphate cytidylyltransferase [Bacteroidales bacterium]